MGRVVTITNEEVDKRLEGKQIYRIGEYVQHRQKLLFGCKKCGYEWNAMLMSVTKSLIGCPKCAGNARLTNDIVDERLKNTKIYRIGHCKNCSEKIEFGCKSCGHVWKATSDNISRGISGCPKCSDKVKLTHDVIDKNLNARKIIRISEYINNKTKILLKCEVCNFEWKTTTKSLLNLKTGCRKCAGTVLLTNQMVDEKLKETFVYRIGNYINYTTKIEFGCKICENIWKAVPAGVLSGRGCPLCSSRKTEREVYYFLKSIIDQKIITHQYIVKNYFKYKGKSRTMFIDFFIEPNIAIEINGEQHYDPINCFGGKKKYSYVVNRDEQCRKYCKENNIQLLEIRHTGKTKPKEWKTLITNFLKENQIPIKILAEKIVSSDETAIALLDYAI